MPFPDISLLSKLCLIKVIDIWDVLISLSILLHILINVCGKHELSKEVLQYLGRYNSVQINIGTLAS